MTATAALAASDTTTQQSSTPSGRERAFVPVLVLIGMVVAVMSSLGAPLIPTIAQASHVSLGSAEWLLTITLLTGALATPVMGRLADGPHQRRVIVVALAVVLAGCVLAAVSSAFSLLVIGRGLQGMGLGLMPVTMAAARRHLPPRRAGSTIALLSVTTAVGIGLGYPITGLLAEASDYHLAFWFGALVVAIALILSALILPASSPAPARRFDVVGAAQLSVALAIFILVLSEGAMWGWLSARVIGLFAASLVLAAVWAGHELRIRDPLVELRQARNRMVLTADLSGFFISLSMYLFLPIVVEFIQAPESSGYGFGSSVVVAGCVLIPLSVGTLIASRSAAAFERRYGRRIMIPLGSVLFAVAMVVFALEHSGLWEAFLVMAIAGVGIGFTFAAMPGFIVASVRAEDTGSAMGFYQVLRSIGLAVGSALAGVLLAAYTQGQSAFPTVGGFRAALLVGAVLCLLTAVLSYALPGAPVTGSDDRTLDSDTVEVMEENAEIGGSGIMLAGAGVDSR